MTNQAASHYNGLFNAIAEGYQALADSVDPDQRELTAGQKAAIEHLNRLAHQTYEEGVFVRQAHESGQFALILKP